MGQTGLNFLLTTKIVLPKSVKSRNLESERLTGGFKQPAPSWISKAGARQPKNSLATGMRSPGPLRGMTIGENHNKYDMSTTKWEKLPMVIWGPNGKLINQHMVEDDSGPKSALPPSDYTLASHSLGKQRRHSVGILGKHMRPKHNYLFPHKLTGYSSLRAPPSPSKLTNNRINRLILFAVAQLGFEDATHKIVLLFSNWMSF